ncbi:MAG: DUF3987 domain-containing protein [Deltaproteobacteria bacterium]|nr:DUF3987 domain-containing protein [Deltaproteobacteria bacterium]
MSEFCSAIVDELQVSPDMVASLCLAVWSAVCARRYSVQIGSGTEPVGLYVAAIAESGERKSATLAALTRPLVEYEATIRQEWAPEIAKKAAEKEVLEKRYEAAKRAAAKNPEGDNSELLRLAEEIAAFEMPSRPRVLIDDCTLEQLVKLLAENGSLAVVSAEGGIFAHAMGVYREKKNKLGNSDVLMKGYSGEPITVDRIGRTQDFAASPSLSIATAVQPYVISCLTKDAQLRGRGFTARFLFTYPPAQLGHRDVDSARPIPVTVRHRYECTLRKMLELGALVERTVLDLTPEAHKRWLAFQKRHEPKLLPGGALGGIQDWGSKLTGGVLRLAALLELATDPTARQVTEGSIARATRLVDYFSAHAVVTFLELDGASLLNSAKGVLRWLRKKGEPELSARTIFHGVRTKTRLTTMDDCMQALLLLQERGWVRIHPARARGPGRPPAPTVELNPALLRPDQADRYLSAVDCAEEVEDGENG